MSDNKQTYIILNFYNAFSDQPIFYQISEICDFDKTKSFYYFSEAMGKHHHLFENGLTYIAINFYLPLQAQIFKFNH